MQTGRTEIASRCSRRSRGCASSFTGRVARVRPRCIARALAEVTRMAARSSPARLVRSSADKPAQIARRRTAWLSQKFDDITLSDRLELLERLSAAAAVAERAARRRAEDVLERRVRGAAVRAPVYGRLELDELRRGD